MRRDVTGSVLKEWARITQSSRRRPDPPVGLKYDAATGVLSWEAPIRSKEVTHYRVYAENEKLVSLAREVSAGQTQIADLFEATNVIVVSYNVHFDTESEPVVLIGANVAPPVLPTPTDTSVTLDSVTVTY